MAGQAVKRHVEPIVPYKPKPPWQAIFSILVALFYDASPIDVIPDIIPILGWLDDGLVTLLMIAFAIAGWRKWAKAKKAGRLQAAAEIRRI